MVCIGSVAAYVAVPIYIAAMCLSLQRDHVSIVAQGTYKMRNAKVRIGRCIKCEIKMRKISHSIRVAEKCIKCEMQKCENAKLVVSVLSM